MNKDKKPNVQFYNYIELETFQGIAFTLRIYQIYF